MIVLLKLCSPFYKWKLKKFEWQSQFNGQHWTPGPFIRQNGSDSETTVISHRTVVYGHGIRHLGGEVLREFNKWHYEQILNDPRRHSTLLFFSQSPSAPPWMYFQVTLSRGEMPDHLRTTQEHLVDVLRTGESRGQVKQIKFFTRVKRKNS